MARKKSGNSGAEVQDVSLINHNEHIAQAYWCLINYFKDKVRQSIEGELGRRVTMPFSPAHLQHDPDALSRAQITVEHGKQVLFAFTETRKGITFIVSFDKKDDGTPDFKISSEEQVRKLS